MQSGSVRRPLLAFVVGLGALLATPVVAAPRVVATIPAVHSLAANVMQGIGTPYLLVRGGASPHSLALRPSDAKALSEAEVIFWIGEELETFLTGILRQGVGRAQVVSLLRAPGVERLALRSGANWTAHDHDHDHDHGRDHEERHEADRAGAEQDADHDHDHDNDAHKAAGSTAESGHASHDEAELDAHIWLNPGNAVAMVEAMAAALVAWDPANGAAYRRNAADTIARLQALTDELATTLAPVRTRPYVVFHDAYQHFEHAFGTHAIGSVTLSPELRPGAKRLAELHRTLKEGGAVCIFAEPQFEPRLVRSVTEGTGVRIGTLDPVGASLAPGPGAYFTLMRKLADDIAGCLSVATD